MDNIEKEKASQNSRIVVFRRVIEEKVMKNI